MPGLNIDLQFDGPQHSRLLKRILAHHKASRQRMSARRKKWDEADDLYQAYVPESDADAKRRTRLEQLGEQSYKTISIPYSYATLLTAHTYWASVFLGRTPI
ncbi:MAG TPA: hypothetical protein VLH56_19125, partial [Dissulfurispiraceae bacterium]|nr:hypothetical protein [Dissulfurispiraceae bacterium]